MDIGGTFIVHGETYFVSLSENKTKRTWIVASEVHSEDMAASIFGGEAKYPRLNRPVAFNGSVDRGYIAESVVHLKASNKISVYRNTVIINELIELIQKAQTYGFEKSAILEDSVKSADGVLRKTKIARDSYMRSEIVKKNNQFSTLEIECQGLVLSMREGYKLRPGFKVIYETKEEIESDRRRRDVLSTSHALDFESLRELLDLSWYEKDGKILMDYDAIQNIKQFEEWFMKPFMELLMANRILGKKTPLATDTETTGLNFFKLSPANPILDKITAIPLSYKLDSGRIVFIGMEHFGNVPLEYALERLRPLMFGTTGERKLEQREVTVNERGEETWEVVGEWIFNREDIILTGHNSPFDGRVFYHHGLQTYWNEDTLQMFFNLNPRIAKGAGSLKNLTEKLRGRQAPELSDILGRGNEGNFHKITDIRVAILYGCADGDNTLFLREKGQKLMGEKMYRKYQRQDIPLLNRLFISEYTGVPIDEEEFIKEGKIVRKNMDIMEEEIYKHVGRIVDYRTDKNALKQRLKSGVINEDQYLELARELDHKTYDNSYFKFSLRGDELRSVLFDVLGYRKVVLTKKTKKYPLGQPSVDKAAIEALLKFNNTTPKNWWKEDVKGEDGTVLLKKDTLNIKEYPLAYILMEYKKLDKEWTSYFQPITENNLEGKMFKNYSMARIETRRIMNPAQTMKAKLKYYVRSFGPDWYLVDFDQMQAEPRIMVSLSGNREQIDKFKDPEKDYHTETASTIKNIMPHELSKYVRKIYKTITLGLPYGIGARKMCAQIHDGEVNRETLFKTNCDIDLWKKVNHDIWEMLKGFQREPLTEAKFDNEMVDFLWRTTRTEAQPEPRRWGKITNAFGFYRLFDITDVVPGDYSTEGKIMRPAGNYPIQSMAAEIFRKILMTFFDRCVEEGLEDKIIWHMLIHDELLMSVHNSVHPFLMYKILHESCTVTFPGHTTYFIGINIGNSWGECKEDPSEAPVKFVERIITRWDAGEFRDDDYQSDIRGYIKRHMKEFFDERIGECLFEKMPRARTGVIDLPKFLSVFSNYVVRAYIPMHYSPNRKVDKDNSEAMYESCFETWVIDYFGEGKEMIGMDGKLRKVFSSTAKLDLELPDEEDDIVFEEEPWTFEDNDLDEIAYRTYVDYEEESYEDQVLREHLEAMEDPNRMRYTDLKKEDRYKNLELSKEYLIVKMPRVIHAASVKRHLNPSRSEDGYTVVLQHSMGRETWLKVDKSVDLLKLDEFVGGLK